MESGQCFKVINILLYPYNKGSIEIQSKDDSLSPTKGLH